MVDDTAPATEASTIDCQPAGSAAGAAPRLATARTGWGAVLPIARRTKSRSAGTLGIGSSSGMGQRRGCVIAIASRHNATAAAKLIPTDAGTAVRADSGTPPSSAAPSAATAQRTAAAPACSTARPAVFRCATRAAATHAPPTIAHVARPDTAPAPGSSRARRTRAPNDPGAAVAGGAVTHQESIATARWANAMGPLRRSVSRALAEHPFQLRPIEEADDPFLPSRKAPARKVWLKAQGKLPDDPALHAYLLAYASDHGFITTALLPHGVTWFTPGMQVASLDHVMWFHRSFRVDEWLLYVIDSPAAHGARGLVRGRIFSEDGRLVASCAQEGLMRKHTAR